MQEIEKGSIMDLSWNPDSMIAAMATVNYALLRHKARY